MESMFGQVPEAATRKFAGRGHLRRSVASRQARGWTSWSSPSNARMLLPLRSELFAPTVSGGVWGASVDPAAAVGR